MKKAFFAAVFLGCIACNNKTESAEQKRDTSVSSSADSILKAVEKMKADSAALNADTTHSKNDSLQK
jgi:hypothetical protein